MLTGFWAARDPSRPSRRPGVRAPYGGSPSRRRVGLCDTPAAAGPLRYGLRVGLCDTPAAAGPLRYGLRVGLCDTPAAAGPLRYGLRGPSAIEDVCVSRLPCARKSPCGGLIGRGGEDGGRSATLHGCCGPVLCEARHLSCGRCRRPRDLLSGLRAPHAAGYSIVPLLFAASGGSAYEGEGEIRPPADPLPPT